MSQDQPRKSKSSGDPRVPKESKNGGLFQKVIRGFKKSSPTDQPPVTNVNPVSESRDQDWDDDFDFIPPDDNDDEISNWDDDEDDIPPVTNQVINTVIPEISKEETSETFSFNDSVDAMDFEVDRSLSENQPPSVSSPPHHTLEEEMESLWEEPSVESTNSRIDWDLEENKSIDVSSSNTSSDIPDHDPDVEWEEPSIEVNKKPINSSTSSPQVTPQTKSAKMSLDSLFKNVFNDLFGKIVNVVRKVPPISLGNISPKAFLIAIGAIVLTMVLWSIPRGTNPPEIANNNTPITTTNSQRSIAVETSPEQALINSVQGEIVKIIEDYPDDIIKTLEVNFDRGKLMVTLNNVWYLINDNKQDEISDRLWDDARQYHFYKLELRDINNNFIARNPVVGKHMVISKRRNS